MKLWGAHTYETKIGARAPKKFLLLDHLKTPINRCGACLKGIVSSTRSIIATMSLTAPPWLVPLGKKLTFMFPRLLDVLILES